MASYKVAVLTNRPGPHVLPVVSVTVDAIDADLIPAGGRFSHDDIVATAVTDEAGVATFSAISGTTHWFRARMTESHFIEVIGSSSSGLSGCWDAIILADGSGTDATLQDAIDRLDGGGGGSIIICDILDEQVTFPGTNADYQIEGIERNNSGIIATANGATAVLIENSGVVTDRIRFANMRIGTNSASGTTTAIQLGSALSPAITDLRLINVLIDNGGTGTHPTHALWVGAILLGIQDALIDQCEIHTSGDAIRMGAIDVIISKTWLDSTGIGYTGQSGQVGLHIVDCYWTCNDICLRLGTVQQFVIANAEFNTTVNNKPVIEITTGQDGQIIGCTIQRTVAATTGDGIQVLTQIQNVAVGNCFFGRTSSHRHGIHLDTAAAVDGSVIQGNTIQECLTHGIYINQQTNQPVDHLVIIGNTIRECGGDGIHFEQNSTAEPPSNNEMRENVVSGNNITGCTGDAIEFVAPDEFYDRFAIVGNVLCSNTGWGINAAADADVRNTTIVGNVIQNNTAGIIQNLTDTNNGKVIQHNA